MNSTSVSTSVATTGLASAAFTVISWASTYPNVQLPVPADVGAAMLVLFGAAAHFAVAFIGRSKTPPAAPPAT